MWARRNRFRYSGGYHPNMLQKKWGIGNWEKLASMIGDSVSLNAH